VPIGPLFLRRLGISIAVVGAWLVLALALLFTVDAVFGPTAGFDWLQKVLLFPLGSVASVYEWLAGRRAHLHGGEVPVHGTTLRLYLAATGLTYIAVLTAVAYALVTWVAHRRAANKSGRLATEERRGRR
jgi:ABC-type lipoprotein release transport system permease subunit